MNEKIESKATPDLNDTILHGLCTFYALISKGMQDVSKSLDELRNLGYDVKVEHERYTPADVEKIRSMRVTRWDPYLTPSYELRATFDLQVEGGASSKLNYISSHGGYTRITLTEPGSPEEVVGEAYCSIYDGFNKRKGLLTALGRCFHALCERHGFTKADILSAVAEFDYLKTGTEVVKSQTLLPQVM